MLTEAKTEILPPVAAASAAYAAGDITTAEYNAGLPVAELEEEAGPPLCRATWRDVEAGDIALVPRFGLIEEVEILAVEKNLHSVLADYVIDGRAYHGVMFAPDQTAYIQQR